MLNFKRIGYKIRKYNIKFIIMPIICFVLLTTLLKSSKIIFKGSNLEFNSYSKITEREYKINYILDKYGLTKEEFDVLSAIVLTEAEYNSYDDAYAVINTIYNRTHSNSWVTMINNKFGEDKGKSLYYQAIAPSQFVVYEHGTYKKNLNNTTAIGFDAIIDFLYSEEILHNYLSFRAHYVNVGNSEKFSNKGNNYFNVLIEENRV